MHTKLLERIKLMENVHQAQVRLFYRYIKFFKELAFPKSLFQASSLKHLILLDCSCKHYPSKMPFSLLPPLDKLNELRDSSQ